MPAANLEQLVNVVATGELISFPTDTVPALACAPPAAARLFACKGRDAHKPLILLGATWRQLAGYIRGTAAEHQAWQSLAERFWPGPLTLVLPAADTVPLAMHPKDPDTIGIRVPQHPLALTLLQRTGALATSSANRSGAPPLETMGAIATQFPEVWTLFDPQLNPAHPTGTGQPSTVVRWTETGWQLIRQGAIAITALSGGLS
jgi:L-threonylcarbamoyladenylate synthase